MFSTILHRRSVFVAAKLLFSAALLALATSARAEQYTTYTIVDYPQPDDRGSSVDSFVDSFTGTITIPTSEDNATYTYDSALPSDLNATLTITGPSVTITTPFTNGFSFAYEAHSGGLKFTPTTVTLLAGNSLRFTASDGLDSFLNLYWYNQFPAYPYYHSLSFGDGNDNISGVAQFTQSDFDLPPAGSDMLIATVVPEPSTLALLGIGAVSLLAYAWRKRTRTA
jgi:hypothetical protein